MPGAPAFTKRLAALVLLAASAIFAQANTGELHLKVTDPSGLGIQAKVAISSRANEYHKAFTTDPGGNLEVKSLPFGVYQIEVDQPGFAKVSAGIEIRSVLPTNCTIRLALSPVSTAVTVTTGSTLVNPHQAGSVNQIGTQMIQRRFSSLPGRSLQDLVNSEPGWLYEGNAVLHPRGSEYQTQFVLDGIPLTDNRSPGAGPEIEADDVQSMTIYTAGIPAEYGRKLGGVIEVNTLEDVQQGFHGEAVLSGGSYDTAGAFLRVQDVWGSNTLGFSASGDGTSHYLNPVVPQNYTNRGTTGDYSGHYERDFTPGDRLSVAVRHEFSRYQIPNEQIQQAAGQRQDGDNFETMGMISYQHTFSPDALGALRGMVRDDSSDLNSNPLSTPIIALQHNHWQEGYFNASILVHHGHQEWKAGVDSDSVFLHENFSDVITNPSLFDPGTPLTFAFPDGHPSAGSRPDLEQSAYIQDQINLASWTISAGLRWDHYQLIVNRQAASPRLSVARYFRSADLVLHASYDRIFQTPSSENLLLSSSPLVQSINPNVLRLPVLPSYANYYEAGLTKGFFSQLKLSANYYRRLFDNYADDNLLLNTPVSFPIAFRKAIIYGAESKLELPNWRRFSGYATYSYMVGNAWFPVTGGLLLGVDALNAPTQLTGHFPVTQDQRNTVRERIQYQVSPRFWIATGAQYGSGLPFDFTGTEAQALAQYGPQVVSRLNFNRGRVRPNFSLDVSAGAQIYQSDRWRVRFQADGENLTNRLNVLDFAGLFSGNAIAPARSFALRLTTDF